MPAQEVVHPWTWMWPLSHLAFITGRLLEVGGEPIETAYARSDQRNDLGGCLMSDARERRAEMSDVRQGCGMSEVQMFFGVLGPLVVEHGGLPVPLGAKQRLVLAMLLMNAGRPVSVDRLIDGVWGEEPPDSAVNTLQVHISQLRRSLAAGDPAILTQPPGSPAARG